MAMIITGMQAGQSSSQKKKRRQAVDLSPLDQMDLVVVRLVNDGLDDAAPCVLALQRLPLPAGRRPPEPLV
jgi:hypothetical protein